MEEKGIGFGIDKWASTEVILLAINKVLKDDRYKNTKLQYLAYSCIWIKISTFS
jgi:ubiquinone biosynthesis protein UbiJ